MPEHAEVFAHCPITVREPVSRPSGVHHASPYTNQIMEEIHSRRAEEALEAQAQTHHQHAQVSSRMQSQAPSRVQSPMRSRTQTRSRSSHQPNRPPRAPSRVEVREKELREEEWEMGGVEEASSRRPTPPSPATPSKTVAVVNGINNEDETAIMTGSSAVDAGDIPDAILDPYPENTIHSKGNLLLVVGSSDRQRSILVQAETLEHFGQPWQDVIKDSNRERLFSTRHTSYLPDDDADMMLVLMYLSHSWHIAKVPKELSFQQLLAMTRICEKYDMNTQVSPFVRRWIVPHQEKLLSPGREEWLFIAHQFGLERHYITLAQHLVLSCRTKGDRTLFTPGKGEKLEGLVPEGALVEIRRKRIKALSTFLDIVYKHIDGLENGGTCRATLPPSPNEVPDEEADMLVEAERAMCTHCNHGELIRYLKIHGFWPPIVQTALVKWPVNEVYEKLTSVPTISYRHIRNSYVFVPGNAPAASLGNAHAICDVGKQLAALITDAHRELQMPIAMSTIKEIRENAKKVGLKDEAAAPNFLPAEESLNAVNAAGYR